jgi:hypothetical protein
MPDIVLSSAVRDNLLSLKKTAAFQETTQNTPCDRSEGEFGPRQSKFILYGSNPERPGRRSVQTFWTTWDRPFRRCALLMTA